MKKKAAGLTMNTVVIAIILLFALLILMYIAANRLGIFSSDVEETAEAKTCTDTEFAGNKGEIFRTQCPSGYSQSAAVYEDLPPGSVCCYKS